MSPDQRPDLSLRPGAAFANGTEWDAWSAAWCERCLHEPHCPILDLAISEPDKTPTAWRDNVRHSLGARRFDCTAFTPATGALPAVIVPMPRPHLIIREKP